MGVKMNMQRLSFSLLLFCLTCSTEAFADLYQWTDSTGALHIVDESVEVPTEFRGSVKVYRATKPSSMGTTPLPLRSFAENTQGSLAQKLARDLGLIKGENEDALSALTGVGISPAGGWKVYDPLTREAAYEVIASARRAAESRRLSLSADGAEGVVRQALGSFTFADALQEEGPLARRVGYEEDGYYDNQPAVVEYVQEVIEVVPEPVYIYSPSVVVTSHRHSHRPRRFRHQPTAPPDASAALPFSSSRSVNERSGRPLFSTSPLPLTQPLPFPFASPHSNFPFASPHPGARR